MARMRTATVLFTDLVDSTALSSRLGPEAADEFRRAHLAGSSDAVRRAGGHVVKNLGDGIMASFDSAAAAIDAAIAVQAESAPLSRRAGEPVSLRVGISNGDVTEDDGDLFGEPVVQAARLCAAAEAGQTLVTELIQMLTAGRGHDLREVGNLTLKGLPAPVMAFELLGRPSAAAVPVPRMLEPRGLGFTGREAELVELHDAWARVRQSGAPAGVVLEGEPGAGKSALAATFAHQLHGSGVTVVAGACDAELEVPYEPWIEVLTHLLAHGHDDLPESAGELGRLGAGIAGRLGHRAPTSSDPETERYLLHAAVTDLVAAGQPMLVVIDDVQWADRESLILLRRLLSSPCGEVLVVVTHRSGEDVSDHFADLLGALRRLPDVRWLGVSPLAESDVAELMAELAGHALDPVGLRLAGMIATESGGNAFFAEALLRDLSETGALFRRGDGRWAATDQLQQLGLPAGVRDVVRQRLGRLGDAARTVLQALSVAGTPITLATLIEVTGLDVDVVADALESATRGGMLLETDQPPVKHTFTHALIARALTDSLGAARRQLLHERYARHFDATGEATPGVTAHHWLQAGTDPEAARRACLAAGRAALDGRAPADALRWFDRALELSPDQSAERVQLLMGRAEAQKQVGDADHRTSILAAAAEADALGDEDLVIDAALLTDRGGLATTLGSVDHDVIAIIRRALRSPRCSGGIRARLLMQLSNELLYEPDTLDERHRHIEEAWELASESGEDRVIGHALMGSGGVGNEVQGVHEGYDRSGQAVAAARRVGDPALRFRTLHTGGMVALAVREIDVFFEWVEEMGTISDVLGHPLFRCLDLGHRTIAAMLRGDLVAAEEMVVTQLELAPGTGYADSMLLASIQLMRLRMEQGRLAELLELIEATVDETPGMVGMRAAAAVAAIQTGEMGRAKARADALDESLTGYGAPNYTTSLSLWSEVAGSLRDQRIAALLLPMVQEDPGLLVCNGWTVHGVLAHHEAVLLDVLGRFQEADAAFELALQMHDELEMPFFIADTCLRWAELLRDRLGRADDARALLERSAALCLDHGYRLWTPDGWFPNEPSTGGPVDDMVTEGDSAR